MRIVVAGSEGLIGQAVVHELHQKHHCVVEVDLKNKYCPDLRENNVVEMLVKQDKVTGFVNCAYPKGWVDHTEYFMKATELFAMYMAGYHGGSIVNMASIYGEIAPDFSIYEGEEFTHPLWYSFVKAGIIAHSKAVATRWAHRDAYQVVRINCVAAGGVYDPSRHTQSFHRKYSQRVPLGRMALPRDIATVITFLLDPFRSYYINGQCINACGGLTAW